MTVYLPLAEQVLGVRPPFDDPEVMASQAYTALTGEQADIRQLFAQNASIVEGVQNRKAEVGLARALYELEPDALEKSTMLNALFYVLKERNAGYATVLGTLPLYHAMYAEHAGLPKSEEPDRKALLVGSLSPVSSAAFVALSKCVMQAEPWIVDPRAGRSTRRHGNFVEANGLALPDDWSGSMHAVVTNRLLHMLVDADGRLTTGTEASERYASSSFAKETFRLLNAGGHLLLCEQPPRVDIKDLECTGVHNREAIAAFDETMRTVLDDAGFSRIHITAGGEPANSNYLFQPFDPGQPFAHDVERPYTRAIYAQKPTD